MRQRSKAWGIRSATLAGPARVFASQNRYCNSVAPAVLVTFGSKSNHAERLPILKQCKFSEPAFQAIKDLSQYYQVAGGAGQVFCAHIGNIQQVLYSDAESAFYVYTRLHCNHIACCQHIFGIL